MSNIRNLIRILIMTVAVAPTLSAEYPPVPNYPGDTSGWGTHIQRTMGLLENSTAEAPNTVRILFYGQSIMGGQWHEIVEKWLRERYPHARLEIENRALGGFSAAYLYRTAHHDLYPFYPDLVVFHVYGDHNRYEEIIHDIRQRTTAEVMILTDHWNADRWKDGELEMNDWDRFYDRVVLPRVAGKYEAELVDVRNPWGQYLRAHGLKPADLLTDNVHLNEHGKWLMAQLTMRQMLHRPELMTERSRDLVRDIPIGDEIRFEDGRLRLPFTGNRVSLVSDSAGIGAVEVRIDGRAPSDLPESYFFTRPSGVVPPQSWPPLYRIRNRSPLVEEHWTLELLEVDDEWEDIRFRVVGSVTGPDGEGRSGETFTSDSGRVVIESEDWVLPNAKKHQERFPGKPLAPGMKIHWWARSHGEDVYVQPSALGQRSVTPVFQGGFSEDRELELRADGRIEQIRAIRIHTPPVGPGTFEPMGLRPGDTDKLDEGAVSEPTPDSPPRS
ncbi:MAG: hypothetical protein ACLFVC_01585 [Opitutales bacterium]